MFLPSVIFGVALIKFGLVTSQPEKFRILAPQFICTKDDKTPIDQPDNTVITIQTAVTSTRFVWTVRWSPLPSPTQRHTLMLWKAVRALEARLNRPQPDSLVYVIQNSQLVQGVDYVFNVTAFDSDGVPDGTKSFHIDNSQGDAKLDMLEGRGDKMSILLVGEQTSYVDLPFQLDAQVTTCFPTQDYYFVWKVQSHQSDHSIDVSKTKGYKLDVPPFSFKSGQIYDVNCQVIKQSTGFILTQTGLAIQILSRGLSVYLSADLLLVTVKRPFTIESFLPKYDDYDDIVMYEWRCTFSGKECDIVLNSGNSTLFFPDGLSEIGEYEIEVEASVGDQTTNAKMAVVTVEPSLPLIKVPPMPRIINEGSTVTLVANASDVMPTCTLTWYFTSTEHLAIDSQSNSTCEDCQHGDALSDTITIFSLEESFLNELTDFTNATEWRQVTGTMPAASGRARFVSQCGCSLTFECESLGMVYADLYFELNQSPKINDLKVTPSQGSALETVFRLSTRAASDPNTPLRYSFYCAVGVGMGANGSLLLDSFVEQLAMETFLPYTAGGVTKLWLESCDSYGACSKSDPITVEVATSDGSTIEVIIEEMRGHIRRCELIALTRLVVLAISSFINAAQQERVSRFTEAMTSSMKETNEACVQDNPGLYTDLLSWLDQFGIDNSSF